MADFIEAIIFDGSDLDDFNPLQPTTAPIDKPQQDPKDITNTVAESSNPLSQTDEDSSEISYFRNLSRKKRARLASSTLTYEEAIEIKKHKFPPGRPSKQQRLIRESLGLTDLPPLHEIRVTQCEGYKETRGRKKSQKWTNLTPKVQRSFFDIIQDSKFNNPDLITLITYFIKEIPAEFTPSGYSDDL